MSDLATRSEMSKQLMNGVGGVGGGTGLLLVAALATSSWVFWVAAGICAVVGVGMIISKKQKRAGFVMAAAAGVVGLAGLIVVALGPFGSWLAALAGLGLIGLGAFQLFKFFREMKKRS